MPLETKVTAKIITLLQSARDQLEQAGDLPGSQNITTAIASVVMASGEAEKPAATQEQIDDLQRMAALTPDFYRKSLYHNDWVVKSARVQAFGDRSLSRRQFTPELALRPAKRK